MDEKRKELTEGERNQIIGAWKCGVPVSTIKDALNFEQSTVYRVINLYKKTGEIKPPPRPGPQHKLTERDTRHLIHLVKKDRKSSLNVLTNNFVESTSANVCPRTVQRYLHKEGYYGRMGKRKPFVNEKNRKIRLEWAKERLNWKEEWKFIIWSDESH